MGQKQSKKTSKCTWASSWFWQLLPWPLPNTSTPSQASTGATQATQLLTTTHTLATTTHTSSNEDIITEPGHDSDFFNGIRLTKTDLTPRIKQLHHKNFFFRCFVPLLKIMKNPVDENIIIY